MLQWRNKHPCSYRFGPRKSFPILSLYDYSWMVSSCTLPALCVYISKSSVCPKFSSLSITVQNLHLPFLQTNFMCLDLGLVSTDCVYFLFVEHLLWVRSCARSWDPELNKTDGPSHQGAHSLGRKMNNKHRNKNHQNKQPEAIGWRTVLQRK